MKIDPITTPRDNATMHIFKQGGRTYESRLNDCGKVNCLKCGGEGQRHPSHGPYWYLCLNVRGAWVRIYLGKDLDTKRYVTPDGQIDWEAVKTFRARKMTTVAHRPSKTIYPDAYEEQTTSPDTLPSPVNPLVL